MEIRRSALDEVPEEIYQILNEFGVPAHLEGYDYIAYSSMMLLDDSNRDLCITKDIYAKTAEVFNKKSGSVDRALRHMIEWVFNNTDSDILEKYFGNSIPIDKGKVSNSQFLYTVARIARRKILSNKHRDVVK